MFAICSCASARSTAPFMMASMADMSVVMRVQPLRNPNEKCGMSGPWRSWSDYVHMLFALHSALALCVIAAFLFFKLQSWGCDIKMGSVAV